MHVQLQAGNSAQHWSTVVLPINTVAAAGAWILADRRGDGRRAAGFFEVQGHSDSPQLLLLLLLFGGRMTRPFDGRRAVAWLKYLVIAQSLNI